MLNYLRDVKSELDRVVWPTKKQTTYYTIATVLFAAIVAAYLGVFDVIFNEFLKAILEVINN